MAGETITAYYEKDHDRLDHLFQQFKEQKGVDFPKAKVAFREFRHGLLRHILWEEEILFPLFEEKSGTKNFGPTSVMRYEHGRIKEILELVHDKVRASDPSCDPEAASLLTVLGEHNMKEEQILYPMIDKTINISEREEVFQKMEKISAQTQGGCCQGSHLSEN